MTERGLKTALAISVALNVFVVGAVAGGLIVGGRILSERQHRERPPVMTLLQSLNAEDRAAAEHHIRQGALSAREDFRAARAARAEAVELAGEEAFDRAAVEAALARSRDSEAAGRTRLEGALLDVMAPLDQEDRGVLAQSLSRRDGRGRGHGRRGGRDRPEPREALLEPPPAP